MGEKAPSKLLRIQGPECVDGVGGRCTVDFDKRNGVKVSVTSKTE